MIYRLNKLTQRDGESCKRMIKLSKRREYTQKSTFSYNNRMKDKLKVEEIGIDRKHEEKLESWADKFFPVVSDKDEYSRTT